MWSCKRASSAHNTYSPGEQTTLKSEDRTSRAESHRKESPSGKELTCPVCGNDKEAGDELCLSCHNEVVNTCYRCNAYEEQLNGKLCSDCRKFICAICNRKKTSEDDDLCVKCHNEIERRK